MPKNKRQHFVPACYLKAWCDPTAPASMNSAPYVWIIDKDGTNVRNKAPENILHESDMYTIQKADGTRDLVLEHGLGQLESMFTRIRNSKINYERELNAEEHMLLCAFTAAAQARTPSNREHHRKQWERPLEMMEDMIEWGKTATEEEKSRASKMHITSSNSKGGLSYEQVKKLHENPLQEMLFPIIAATTPLLCKLDMAILVTKDELGFVTSDNPCVWYDPEGYKRPPMYSGPALMYKTIEITLPLSPNHCLFLNRQGIKGYIDTGQDVVDGLNLRAIAWADNHFIAKSKETRDCWFEMPPEPEDSWRKQNKIKTEKKL